MHDPRVELLRRCAQFATHLEALRSRWNARRRNPDCYTIILETREYTSDGNDPSKLRAQVQQLDWRFSDLWSHYVQFAWQGTWFYMELPDSTLGPSEAQRLIAARPAFFYLKDRPESQSAFSEQAWRKLVAEHNPVHRLYRASEIMAAAQDTAYVWFTLWALPLDWVFYTRTAYFKGKPQEELNVSLA
jgi:hypothetical protein